MWCWSIASASGAIPSPHAPWVLLLKGENASPPPRKTRNKNTTASKLSLFSSSCVPHVVLVMYLVLLYTIRQYQFCITLTTGINTHSSGLDKQIKMYQILQERSFANLSLSFHAPFQALTLPFINWHFNLSQLQFVMLIDIRIV